MNDVSLIFPNEEMELQAMDFKRDFFNNNEKVINGSYKLDQDRYSYTDWLQIIRDNLNKEKVNPKFGFSHTFFAITNDEKIIGIVNLRHTLTDFYKDSGHVGYSVRPSERRKGYATEILKQTLLVAKEQSINEILLVCKSDNVASIKTIINNKGKITRTFIKNNNTYYEYTINLI